MYPIETLNMKTTSPYGVKRRYQVNGKWYTDTHSGIDLVPSPSNNEAKILAIASGVVVSCNNKGVKGGSACYVRIKHDNGLNSLYYHLKSGSLKVKKGKKVKKGDVIGIIGDTGLATGVHLHFQIDRGSSATSIDPTEYAYGKKEIDSSTSKILYLPESATKWRVYPLGKPARVGYECGYLLPAKFGGLEYNIIKMVNSDVSIIETRDFGKVQIYVAPSTGAIIK